MLEIVTGRTAHAYEVEEVLGFGYRLHRIDVATGEIVTYAINTTTPRWWRCNCPAATHSKYPHCKHVRALRAALAADPF